MQNEVFLSEEHDIFDISTIKGKFKVFDSKKRMDKFNKRYDDYLYHDVFFCQYSFDLRKKRLSKREKHNSKTCILIHFAGKQDIYLSLIHI